MNGTFYGIGVGPGDPELLTIKAVKILRKIDIVISPESTIGKGSVALDIAREHLRKGTEILKLHFPMTYDENILNEKFLENSRIIIELLEKGKNVAFLTLGDPMVYSTYIYLLKILKKSDIYIETIPGITSFCAIASRLNIPLAEGEETLTLVPLRKNAENLEKALDKFDNLVVMKPSANNKVLAEKLIQKGYADKFILLSRCGTSEEEIVKDINRLKDEKIHYLSTVIIKKQGLEL